MERDEAVREGARAIRFYLESLVGPQAADQLDLRLAELLAADDSQQLLDVLQSSEGTSQWWRDFLLCGGIPAAAAGGAGVVRSDLPGLGRPVLDRYVCPAGNDYVWYRRSPASAVPFCKKHNVQLRAEARGW